MSTPLAMFAVELPEVTWPEVALTGTGSYCVRMPGFSTVFFYYSSSTKCNTVVQVPVLPEVNEGHVTHSGFPWVCACATGICAISAIVGPFDRKWRYETSLGVPLGGRMRDRKCPWGRSLGRPCPISSMATGTSPYHYLPLSRHFHIIWYISIMVFIYGVFG